MLVGYCAGFGAPMVSVTGSATLTAETNRYEFVLSTLLPEMKSLPAPQKGAFGESGGKITLSPEPGAPFWPHLGAFVIGRAANTPITHCAAGGVWKLNSAGNPSGAFWVFTRR
jgi:hypothetical protein